MARSSPPSSSFESVQSPRARASDESVEDAALPGEDAVQLEAAAWFVRRQDGLDDDEAAALRAWIAADPVHAEALQTMSVVWDRLGGLPQAALVRKMPAPEPQNPVRPSWSSGLPAYRTRRVLPMVSAFSAVAIMATAAWVGWGLWQREPLFTQQLATERGRQQRVELPDGSTLWMDTASRAEVALYRNRREVKLIDGQVQLAVEPDARRPFQLSSGPVRVTVVGTRFTVRHTSSGLDAGDVRVDVEEGRVKVSTGEEAEAGEGGPLSLAAGEVLLTAGQGVTVDDHGHLGTVEASAMAGADTPPWREGRLNFNGVPLGQVVSELERYGDTGLVIRDPVVAALRVQGSFDLHHLDAFARALPQVLAVRLIPADGGRTEIVAASSAR